MRSFLQITCTAEPVPYSSTRREEIDTLFKERGTSLHDFAWITERVTLALANLRLQSQGMNMEQLGLMNVAQISEEELATVKKHEETLKKIFDMD